MSVSGRDLTEALYSPCHAETLGEKRDFTCFITQLLWLWCWLFKYVRQRRTIFANIFRTAISGSDRKESISVRRIAPHVDRAGQPVCAG